MRMALPILAGMLLALHGCMELSGDGITGMSEPNVSLFIEAGCVQQAGGVLGCSAIRLEERFSCLSIGEPPFDGNALKPGVQIVECEFGFWNEDGANGSQGGIIREGCMAPIYRRYIALDAEGFTEIVSKGDFVRLFAPVETPEEAMAFALALTDSYADYSPEPPEGYHPVAPSVRPSCVRKTGEGYVVHLFWRAKCGCGTHPYYEIDYLVAWNGDVSEISRSMVYDGVLQMCVD